MMGTAEFNKDSVDGENETGHSPWIRTLDFAFDNLGKTGPHDMHI